MTMRHGSENLACKFFGKENGAFGLAAGAEIPCPARVRQKMFFAAFITANSGKAALKPATVKELFDSTRHYRAHRP
jgi:hypothetical protein